MRPKIRLGKYEMKLPASQWARVAIGVLLIAGGVLGFLPILGFWMVPAGFLVLSVDLPIVRRWRRQLTLWWYRRRREPDKAEAAAARSAAEAQAARPPISSPEEALASRRTRELT